MYWYLHSSFHPHTHNIQADTHRRMILACSHTCADKGSLRNCTRPDLRTSIDEGKHITHNSCLHIYKPPKPLQNLCPLSSSFPIISSPLFTIAGGPIRGELEPLVTGAHEWSICVQTAMSARVCLTLVHIWRERKRKKEEWRKDGRRWHMSRFLLNNNFNLNCNDLNNMFKCMCAPWHVLTSVLRRNPGLQEQEYEPGTLAHSCWQ